MFGKNKDAQETQVDSGSDQRYAQNSEPIIESEKSFGERIWPVMACGAGLFSDGYINNVSPLFDKRKSNGSS